MKNIKTLTIDIDKDNYETIPSVQYDSKTRYLHVYLFNNSSPFDITGCSVKIAGIKADNTDIFNECKVIDPKKGFIEIELTEQMNAVHGLVECELKIYSADGVLTTKPLNIYVSKSVTRVSNITSSNEFTALTNALKTVGEIENKADKTELEKLSSQLDTKVNFNAIKEGDKEFRSGLVTFMCDDGQVTDYTRFYEKVFKPTGTPCSICLVTSRIGNDAKYLTWEQARELKEAGWTVCSHTHNHEYCNQLSNSDLEATLLNSKNLLKENKLDYEYFVIPYGESNNNVINYARKHYKAIVHTGGRFTEGSSDTSGSGRKEYVDNYYLYRRSTGEYGRSLAEMKADVDYAMANGIWLIFIAHSWDEFYSTDEGLQQLRDLIDYIKNTRGMNIVNFEDGLKLKGNVINKGNRYSPEDWYMTTNDGQIFVQSDISLNKRIKNTTLRQSFTPIIKGQNVEGNPTYTTQHGVYKRSMDSIEFSIFLKGTFDDTIDGNVVIGGLPAINKGGLTACNIGLVQKWVNGYVPTGSYIDNDSTDIRLEFTHTSGVHWHIQGANVRGSEFSIVVSGQYFVNMI